MMIFRRFLNTVAAALALALVLALAGCTPGASASNTASAEPADSFPGTGSSLPPDSVAVSTPQPDSSAAPEPETEIDDIAGDGYPAAPEGPFAPVTAAELETLSGSWIFWPNGEENESGGMVWQFRFGQPGPGQMSIAKGIFETDAGVFFAGGWQAGAEEGLYTASLHIWEMGEADTEPPVVTVDFRLAWAGEAREVLLFTLAGYDDSADPRFGERFGDWLDLAIPTYNAW